MRLASAFCINSPSTQDRDRGVKRIETNGRVPLMMDL